MKTINCCLQCMQKNLICRYIFTRNSSQQCNPAHACKNQIWLFDYLIICPIKTQHTLICTVKSVNDFHSMQVVLTNGGAIFREWCKTSCATSSSSFPHSGFSKICSCFEYNGELYFGIRNLDSLLPHNSCWQN